MIVKNNLYDIFSGKDLEIAQLIQRRRLQILVHSCIYYGLNTNLVTDNTFDNWEHELLELQNKYPEIAEKVVYHDAFTNNWDGSSGAFLPYSDPDILSRARTLINKNI